jgi:hypothetical protein
MDNFERKLRRMACRKCGNVRGIEERDGKDCGGLPGIRYRVCDNCGHAQPITKRPRKEKLR